MDLVNIGKARAESRKMEPLEPKSGSVSSGSGATPNSTPVLSSEDVIPKQGGECSDAARQKIWSAVVNERNRSWANQPVGTEAVTELGKKCSGEWAWRDR